MTFSFLRVTVHMQFPLRNANFVQIQQKNIIALYAALLSMNRKAGSSGPDSVINAGYILYAYLGGQAKREISYND